MDQDKIRPLYKNVWAETIKRILCKLQKSPYIYSLGFMVVNSLLITASPLIIMTKPNDRITWQHPKQRPAAWTCSQIISHTSIFHNIFLLTFSDGDILWVFLCSLPYCNVPKTQLVYLNKGMILAIKQRHYFTNKDPYSQSYGFSSSHVWICERWTIKKAEHRRTDDFVLWCWRRLENPLDCKEIKPVNPKRNQSWIFIERTDAKAEAPIHWPTDIKNWLTGEDPDARKDWRQEEKGMTLDEMVGWHHRVNGHQFGQASGDSYGQGSLACCSPWGHKESNTIEWLNNNKCFWYSLNRRTLTCIFIFFMERSNYLNKISHLWIEISWRINYIISAY